VALEAADGARDIGGNGRLLGDDQLLAHACAGLHGEAKK